KKKTFLFCCCLEPFTHYCQAEYRLLTSISPLRNRQKLNDYAAPTKSSSYRRDIYQNTLF
ncbi:unnamed protein product, partial [Ixodes persulcatus]